MPTKVPSKRRPLASSLAKLPSAAAICTVLAIAGSASADAATYYWDADATAAGNDIITGAGLGGAGIWNSTWSITPTASWYDPTAIPPGNVIWPNVSFGDGDTAVFSGTGGAVSLDGTIMVNNLRFTSDGYSITNGGNTLNFLTLSGTTPTIDVVTSGHNATITSRIDGFEGLVKTGAGTLTLGATGNTFSGDVLVTQGTLAFVGVAGSADQTALGAGPKKIILTNNATLALVGTNNADPNVQGGKGFVIGEGGGTISVATGLTFMLNDGVANESAQNQLQGTGTLTKVGLGVLNVGRDFSSTFSGNVIVKEGRLDLTVGNAVGNVGTITVDGANARLNYSSGTAMAISNDLILQNGGVLSFQGSHNLPNTRTITIGEGTGRIRVDDGSSANPTATNRTIVLNGALRGSNTLEVTGPTGASRGVLAISSASGDFSGTIVIDKNVSVENFARFNGTTATNTGKTLGSATIKFAAIAGGSGSSVDGMLDLRDAGTGNNQTFNYGNNVDMSSTGGTIWVGRNTGATTASTGGTFVLGNLALGAGNTLTQSADNAYSLAFSGATTLGGDATFSVATNLTLGGGITGGGNLTKNGAGLLTIGAPQGATYTGTTTINGGGVVFNGANSLGGTGASVSMAAGTYLVANFAATQANLVDRIVGSANSRVIILGESTNADLDFSAHTNSRLGASGTVIYTGGLTQAGTTALLGGGGGTLVLTGADRFAGTRNLDIGPGGLTPGVVAIDDPQSFTGSITLTGGQLLRVGSNSSLGNAANVITANGGGIQFKDAASGFDIFATRTINFTGGFILDTNGYDYTPSVAIGTNGGGAGTGNFTKTGDGKLTLNQPVQYTGKTIIAGGILSIASDAILGAVPGSNTADQLQLQKGGTLEVTESFTIPVQRGLQLTNGLGGGGIHVVEGKTLTLASNTTGNGQLTKSGPGTMRITADPNHTGGTVVEAGTLELLHSGSTDGHFLIKSGATLSTLPGASTGPLGDAYNITVESGAIFDIRVNDTIARLLGGGTVVNNGAAAVTLSVNNTVDATFDGTINNGTATLAFTKSGANTVTFTGKNTYTGTTTINTGVIRVEGASARLNGGGLVAVGDNNGNDESLVLGSNSDVVNDLFDKIGDTSEIDFRGSTTVTFNGPAAGSTAFTETMGNIDFRDGVGSFVLNPATGGQLQINAAALTREFGTGTGVIRGTNLGATGANSSRVLLNSTAGILVGSGGTGSLASIVPFVIGGTSSTAAPDTFLTYNATTGLTPLESSDYASTIAGSAGRNVSVQGGESVGADVSINALRVTGGSTMLSNARVGVDSGAILFTGNGSIDGSGTIDAGSRQLIIHASGDGSALTASINANIAALNGLAVGDAGDIGHTIELGGNNHITGGVTINGGALRLASAGALNAPGGPINELTLKAGNSSTGGALSSVLQLGGNDLTVQFNSADRLQGSARIQNASSNPATLTIITNTNSGGNDGVLENGAGSGALSVVKAGTAQLILDQVNSYTGTTDIIGGTLQLSSANGRLTGTSGITIAGGGILHLNNTNSANQGDRIANGAQIRMLGGQFQFDNNQNAANYSETVGVLNIQGGANQIVTDSAAANQTLALTFASLSMSQGAALNFTNFATTGDIAIGENARNRVIFTTDPATTNGIMGGNVYFTKNFSAAATFDPVDFAAYDIDTDGAGADTEDGVFAFSNYNSGAESTWLPTSVVRPAASATLTTDRTVHAVKLNVGVNLEIGAGQKLNVASGGIIYNPNSAQDSTSTISGGTLTAGGAGAGELAIRVDSNLNAATLAITSQIANNGAGTVALLKSGPDTLSLEGTNTYSGRTTIAEGTLRISSDANLGAAPGLGTPGHLRLHGGTLEIADSMTLNSNRGIELAGGSSTISVANGTLSYGGFFSAATDNAGADLTIRGNVDFSGSVNSIPLSLNVGANLVTGLATNNSTVRFTTAGGTLSVGGNDPRFADLNVGYRTVVPTNDVGGASTVAVLDLQALSSFTATVGAVRLGVIGGSGGSNASARGELLLPATSNITAWNGVTVGDSLAAGNSGPQSLLRFGAGDSTMKTSALTVGGRKGNGRATINAGGTLTLTGFSANSVDLLVAYNNLDNTGVTSSGTFDFTDGTLVADLDELVVGHKMGGGGNSGGANGTVTLGAASHEITANQIRLGDYSGNSTGVVSGTLNIGGGSLVVNSDISLGLYAGNGTAGTANGTLNITGGSVRVGGNIVTSNSARANSTLNLNGGSLDLTGGDISADTFTAREGVLRNVGGIFGGDGVSTLGLTKTGPGTLRIEGTNTYEGGTVLNEGTLLVDGSLNGGVAASSGTTLGGDGIINGAVNLAGATLAPGNGVGSLDINGSLTLGNNSTLEIRLDGPTPGLGYDQVNMTSAVGSVSIGSNVTLSLSLGFTPNTTVDTFYYILTREDNGVGFGNMFAGLNEGASIDLGNGIVGKLTYFANWTGDAATSSFTGGNDVAIAVPEPGTITTLLGLAGGLLGVGRFRRRNSRA